MDGFAVDSRNPPSYLGLRGLVLYRSAERPVEPEINL